MKNTYGYNVILYSPFSNPGNNSSDWQAAATDAYIGIENYISGQDVTNNAFSVSYCQNIYQSSINSYTALGVPRAKLMLGEHFAQTLPGTGYGRAGVTSNAWDSAISVRNRALQNIAFTGFLSEETLDHELQSLLGQPAVAPPEAPRPEGVSYKRER